MDRGNHQEPYDLRPERSHGPGRFIAASLIMLGLAIFATVMHIAEHLID